MSPNRIRPFIAALLALGFTFQLGLQSIPLILLYHAEDGTICTCGCADLNHDDEDTGGECEPTGCNLLCLCDQDHEKRVEFSAFQLPDCYFEIHQSNIYIKEFHYLIPPTFTSTEFGFTFKIYHPPPGLISPLPGLSNHNKSTTILKYRGAACAT